MLNYFIVLTYCTECIILSCFWCSTFNSTPVCVRCAASVATYCTCRPVIVNRMGGFHVITLVQVGYMIHFVHRVFNSSIHTFETVLRVIKKLKTLNKFLLQVKNQDISFFWMNPFYLSSGQLNLLPVLLKKAISVSSKTKNDRLQDKHGA